VHAASEANLRASDNKPDRRPREMAFEPQTDYYKHLVQSIRHNGFSSFVSARNVGLFDAAGLAILKRGANSTNLGNTWIEPVKTLGHDSKHEVCPVARLDDFGIERQVEFIKIDVEGAEHRVLAGATSLLKRDHPIILCEIFPTQLAAVSGVEVREFVAFMTSLGYRMHGIASDGSLTEPPPRT